MESAGAPQLACLEQAGELVTPLNVGRWSAWDIATGTRAGLRCRAIAVVAAVDTKQRAL